MEFLWVTHIKTARAAEGSGHFSLKDRQREREIVPTYLTSQVPQGITQTQWFVTVELGKDLSMRTFEANKEHKAILRSMKLIFQESVKIPIVFT